MKFTTRITATSLLAVCLAVIAFITTPTKATAQQAAPAASTPKPVIEEWVYRTKYGFKDEWWAIFKKYQIAILERQKQVCAAVNWMSICLTLVTVPCTGIEQVEAEVFRALERCTSSRFRVGSASQPRSVLAYDLQQRYCLKLGSDS